MVRRKKAPKLQPEEEEAEAKKGITTRKTGLRKLIRPAYRDAVIEFIAGRSIQAAKMCLTGSLLFLNQVQRAFDENDNTFFEQNGDDVIRECFMAVLIQNVRTSNTMIPEFREFVNDLDDDNKFAWANNNYFGNATGDLSDQYTTNVITNLRTHKLKRLKEYLKMVVYENNLNPIVVRFEKGDIAHAINWAIYGRDSIKVNGIEDVAKRERRQLLLERIPASWWPNELENNNIGRFTHLHWFKSIQIWIAMQRKISEFNGRQANQQPQPRQSRPRQRQPRPRQPRSREERPEGNVNKPPKVKNLAVIPTCTYQRTYYPIDNYTFYKLMCGTKTIPRNKNGTQHIFTQFMAKKSANWNQIFYMRRIFRLVRGKKNFRYRLLSDGVAASLQFDVEKKEAKPIDLDKVRKEYMEGKFVKELGIDPGMKTWNATVQRDIATGKEVSFKKIHIFKNSVANNLSVLIRFRSTSR